MFRHFAFLSLTSFLLNLVWEYVQCELFFVHGTLKPTHLAMLGATLGDVGITWALYGVVALFRKEWLWSRKPLQVRDFFLLVTVASAVGFLIEFHALSSGRWNYTPVNPLVPGTSVSVIPLIQLALLVPLSIVLCRYFQSKRSSLPRK